jgi:hypothetical protein
MNSAKPSRLAAWILQHFGPELNKEALAGDLNEAFQQGRSKAWYWRQVLAAIGWRKFFYKLLILVTWSWVVTWPVESGNSPVTGRLLVMAILMAEFLAFVFVLEMLRGKNVLRTVVILTFFLLLFPMTGMVIWLIWNFASPRKSQGPYGLTVRELVFGDPNAERQRLIEKLHLAMLEEADPQVREAYAESIAALARKLPPAKAAE